MSLPTLYEHYTAGGINSGLNADNRHFTLNDRNITIYGGTMNYFRVHPDQWRDRLRRMRAAGLNTVDMYVPWNLHEPEPGRFDFGMGGSDFQQFLDIEKFLKMVQEEDLFTIVRPGPYICAEWEFGGLPSWLLRDRSVMIRRSEPRFMGHVARYITALFAILVSMQFTMGGSIIAVQIENEYGNFPKLFEQPDTRYMVQLRDLFVEEGIVELLLTSDTPLFGKRGMIPGTLYTANFNILPNLQLMALDFYQPGKAAMVMEFWTGWYDKWLDPHDTSSLSSFTITLEAILRYPASVNFYMFLGGTSWGFMNGALMLGYISKTFSPVTNSYDYGAPLQENGAYTDKYFALKKLIARYNNVRTRLPEMPKNVSVKVYDAIKIQSQMSLGELLKHVAGRFSVGNVIPMEDLPINNGAGQSYGYLIYRKVMMDIPANSKLQIEDRPYDVVMVLIDGKLVSRKIITRSDMDSFGTWQVKDGILDLGPQRYKNATLELVAENMGRVNYGTIDDIRQYKGIWAGDVLLNHNVLYNWTLIPLEFKSTWTNSLTGWRTPDFKDGPSLYKAILTVDDDPEDTFIDMRSWKKGIVIVNGFVLSRYFRLGPQQMVYLPGPFLKTGDNNILIFEHFEAFKNVTFSSNAVWENL